MILKILKIVKNTYKWDFCILKEEDFILFLDRNPIF